MPTLTDADPAIPALPEPDGVDEALSLAGRFIDEPNVPAYGFSKKAMRAFLTTLLAAGRASRVQGEAVASITISRESNDRNGVRWDMHAAGYSLPAGKHDLYTAPQAETLAVADGFVLVPREFVQGFGTLAHNYSLNAEAPDYYHGVERDAFASAYRRCGEDLAKLRAMIQAAPPPTASIAAEAPASVPDGFWLAPMNLDDEAHEAAEGQDDAFPLAGVRSWYAARDSWLARHPAAPNSTALAAAPTPTASTKPWGTGLLAREELANDGHIGAGPSALAAPKAEGEAVHRFEWPDGPKAMAERATPVAQAAVGEWQPIETAPKDGERCLYLAVLDDAGAVKEIDHAAIWGEDTERLEGHVISQGYCWLSANGMEEPTHWAYQDGAPPESQLGRWRYRGGDPETGDSGDLEWEPVSLVDRIKKHVLHLTASDFHPEWQSSVESSMLLDEAIDALTTPRPEATSVAPVAGEVKS